APIVQAFTASRLPRARLRRWAAGRLGSYGAWASTRACQPLRPPHRQRDPVASGGGGGLLALGTEQERKAQAAARQKAEYAKELERQMAEKRATEIKRKREREEFERKKEAEIAAYDPFGKGGGGAPIKDAQGNTRANLKQVMRETDDDRLSNSGPPCCCYWRRLRRFSRPRRRLLIGSRTGRFSRSRRLDAAARRIKRFAD
uniref:Clathrin light chain n=1 Tax=Macrostomum lignano TaxID=282301 RepID=A0A1I8FKY3_9PLAT